METLSSFETANEYETPYTRPSREMASDTETREMFDRELNETRETYQAEAYRRNLIGFGR